MKNNYLVIIENINDINKLKNNGINNFIFPLEFFSIGFNKYFNVQDIKEDNSYILINRILTTREVNKLKEVLENIPSNIKGIIFEDIGLTNILENINIEKILFSNHFCTNSESVNELLDYVDSLVLSTELTYDEINYIIDKSNKDVSLYSYGYLNIAYSRRNLKSNYNKYYDIENKDILKVSNDEFNFLVTENEFGTVIYNDEVISYLDKDFKNVKYHIINLFNINIDEFISDLENNTKSSGFLYKETIYKLKGDK